MDSTLSTESFAEQKAITILRLSKQKDAWLSRKIDFARNMFDLARNKNRHDLCEKYREFEDILIITRIFKNSDAKTKRAMKNSFERSAVELLKHLWQNDYENFIDLLYGEREEFFERFKTNFDFHSINRSFLRNSTTKKIDVLIHNS